MTTTTTAPQQPAAAMSRLRRSCRWLATFLGFPAGGVAAMLLVGPVDSPAAAVVGGLVSGAVLGAVQAWGLGRVGPSAVHWVLATAAGLAAGLGIGATCVGFATTRPALAVQGAICGSAVGAAQALVLAVRSGLGSAAYAWPAVLGVLWAAGWAITSGIGVEVGEQFTVFGSSGAIVVTACTVALPFRLARTSRTDLDEAGVS